MSLFVPRGRRGLDARQVETVLDRELRNGCNFAGIGHPTSDGNGLAGTNGFGERLLDCFHSAVPVLSRICLCSKQTLYALGEAGNKLYLVESGRVKISVLSRGGKQCFLSIHVRGDVMGESCLLGSERMESAIAMVPSVVRQINREQFFNTLNDTGLLADYLGYMAARLVEQQQIIAHFITQDSEHRLASTLLRLGRKIGTRIGDTLRLDQKMTHEELADMVGTTRSRIGYFLNRFRCDGLIDVTSNSLLVIDEAALAKYVEAVS